MKTMNSLYEAHLPVFVLNLSDCLASVFHESRLCHLGLSKATMLNLFPTSLEFSKLATLLPRQSFHFFSKPWLDLLVQVGIIT